MTSLERLQELNRLAKQAAAPEEEEKEEDAFKEPTGWAKGQGQGPMNLPEFEGVKFYQASDGINKGPVHMGAIQHAGTEGRAPNNPYASGFRQGVEQKFDRDMQHKARISMQRDALGGGIPKSLGGDRLSSGSSSPVVATSTSPDMSPNQAPDMRGVLSQEARNTLGGLTEGARDFYMNEMEKMRSNQIEQERNNIRAI